ncbi:hypothetical protein GCM10010171_56510 [Actinokineospora fastidiosa]|uniref:histidine kinase n=1 Tax=Actinokineospora fastidiosa TaxID=1816 RepID=A0A918LI19_9PSEU|nr:hypothetical protein GCM10010171_56510 [Actinokineospora fastidiosa]
MALIPAFVAVSFCGSLLVLNDELGRGRGGATSILLVAAGFIWPTNYLYEWGNPLAIHLSMIGSTLFWWLSACACLMYPQQRLQGAERGYLIAMAAGLGVPEIYLILTGRTYDALPYFDYWILAIGVGFLGVMSMRYRRYKGVARRTLLPVLVSGVGLSLTGAFSWFLLLSSGVYTPYVDQKLVDVVLCVQGILLIGAAPISLAIGGLRRRFIQASVADALARLPPDAPPEALQQALRLALHDDRLEILYWSPNHDEYVDSDGRPVGRPEEDADKVLIRLYAGENRAMAVLVADRQLASEAALFGDVVSAPRQPVLAVWLQVHDRANQEQQRLLNRRLEEERWKERQRLGRDLHDGVQQHLYTLGVSLALASDQVTDGQAAESIGRAKRQLSAILPAFRDLIHELAPPELARNGLACAIHALVERQPISVDLHLDTTRPPSSVEYIAYLITCEAFTNILKHANASQVVITTRTCEHDLELMISDNGIGGADMNRSRGLAGLRDRVHSVGGHLSLVSPSGGGTLLEVRIPCE